MSSFREKMTAKLPLFVYVVFVLQPILDVISFWINRLELSNAPTLIIRMGLLAVIVLVGFFTSRSKREYYWTAGILGVLAAAHIAACIQFGYQSPFSDLANFIRVAQLPITTVCLITMIRENEKCYDAMRYGIVANLIIILIVEVLANVTGTEPHAYPDGTGIVGWFYFANSQSCIMTMIPPVAVVLTMQRKGMKSLSFAVVFLGSMLSLYALGPRLAVAGLVAMGLGLAGSILIIDRKAWKQSLVFALTTVMFIGFVMHSPMVTHQTDYESVQSDRQKLVNAQVENMKLPSLDEEGLSQEEIQARKAYLLEVLAPVYQKYAPDFVKIFGLEKTMEIYNYSYSVREITAYRNAKIQFGKLLMEQSPKSSWLFGVELGRFTVNGVTYDVENDFHGIYFLYGVVGLAAMIAFIAYFLWLIAKALIRNWKQYFTLEAAAWGIALVMALLHAYFTAAILRRPNASFYLSVDLAAIYYLVKIKTYSTPSDQIEE